MMPTTYRSVARPAAPPAWAIGPCGRPCATCTERCPRAGLGFTSAPQMPTIPGWLKLAALALAALLVYRLIAGGRGQAKRAKLRAAKLRYQTEVARIKAQR